MTESEFRKAIVREALSWKGTPYRLGSRVKGAGVDCATLLLATYQAVGLVPPDEQAHLLSHDWWSHTTEERYKLRVVRHATKTVEAVTYRTLDAKPGDILLVKAANARLHNHGGIVIEWPRLIHAIHPAVEVIDGTSHCMWQYQTVEVYSPWERWLEKQPA
jgi:cell wall-associated NlpC family hydrolase